MVHSANLRPQIMLLFAHGVPEEATTVFHRAIARIVILGFVLSASKAIIECPISETIQLKWLVTAVSRA